MSVKLLRSAYLDTDINLYWY